MRRSHLIGIILPIFILISRGQKTCRHSDIDTCKCELVNGSGVIDISFGNQDGTPMYKGMKGPTNTYSYNPCYAFKSEDGITGLATLGNDGHGDFSVGDQKGATWKTDNGSLFILYSTSDKYFTSTVNLFCDESQTSNYITAQGPDSTYTNYIFHMSGAALCPVAVPKDDKLSIGSIALIGVAVVFVIYLFVGIVYKKTRTDASGTDLLPNKNFWSSLPGLIKDGAVFLVYKCKRQAQSGYENI